MCLQPDLACVRSKGLRPHQIKASTQAQPLTGDGLQANRESARRVRKKRAESLDDMQAKVLLASQWPWCSLMLQHAQLAHTQLPCLYLLVRHLPGACALPSLR